MHNSDRNAAIARGTQALINGELDPQLVQLLSALEDYVELEGAGGDYYHLEGARRKSDNMAGKVFLVAEPRAEGMSQHPLTHRAITATQQLHENNGVPLIAAPSKEPAIARMNELLDKYVMATSVAGIGSGGQRHQRNAEQLRDVAASLLVDTDRGYNSRAGYALGGMPLDAGHVIGHASRPDLSDKGFNLEWENQYANKGKAATEKIAANQGREATDAELAEGLFKSHKNKLLADVVLPGRKGSKERNAFMQPINNKVNNYLAEQGIEGTSGSNDIVINSQGGDVTIGDKAMDRFGRRR